MIPDSKPKLSFPSEWPLAIAVPIQAATLGALCAALIFGGLELWDFVS